MASIPTPTVHRLAEAQNWRCCWCGFRMLPRHPSRFEIDAVIGTDGKAWHRRRLVDMRMVTPEHVVPRCDGGTDDPTNLAAACRFCNEFRSNHPVEVAIHRISRMLRRGTHPFQAWERGRTFLGNCRMPSIEKPPRAPAATDWPEIRL